MFRTTFILAMNQILNNVYNKIMKVYDDEITNSDHFL